MKFLKNYAKYGLDPVPELEPEPELELELSWNFPKSEPELQKQLRFHNTALRNVETGHIRFWSSVQFIPSVNIGRAFLWPTQREEE